MTSNTLTLAPCPSPQNRYMAKLPLASNTKIVKYTYSNVSSASKLSDCKSSALPRNCLCSDSLGLKEPTSAPCLDCGTQNESQDESHGLEPGYRLATQTPDDSSPSTILFQILEALPSEHTYIHYTLLETCPPPKPFCTEMSPSPMEDENLAQPSSHVSPSAVFISKHSGDLRRFIDDMGSLPLADHPPRTRLLSFWLPSTTLNSTGVVEILMDDPPTELRFGPSVDAVAHASSSYADLAKQYGDGSAVPLSHVVNLNLSLLTAESGASRCVEIADGAREQQQIRFGRCRLGGRRYSGCYVKVQTVCRGLPVSVDREDEDVEGIVSRWRRCAEVFRSARVGKTACRGLSVGADRGDGDVEGIVSRWRRCAEACRPARIRRASYRGGESVHRPASQRGSGRRRRGRDRIEMETARIGRTVMWRVSYRGGDRVQRLAGQCASGGVCL
ncbi:hypothetical protein P280DRAFT_505115 [Massarina eburnea CBS 473.64]|uniref:Uncharacterized protein n=1 Tax=Massarina eburnea CBS 473.64 TaxID=1395130 RepID=A0A6A6SBU4_9PLEO|nr:hypothetical protein P280DRAFT_505115 [Massarina eburnea CBS 473.64]